MMAATKIYLAGHRGMVGSAILCQLEARAASGEALELVGVGGASRRGGVDDRHDAEVVLVALAVDAEVVGAVVPRESVDVGLERVALEGRGRLRDEGSAQAAGHQKWRPRR